MHDGFLIIVGYLLGLGTFAKVYFDLRYDNRQLINEFSRQNGGHKIFKEREVKVAQSQSTDSANQGAYSIELPSSLEDFDDSEPQMSEADIEHLKRMGVIQ